jgi:hypothetical protein
LLFLFFLLRATAYAEQPLPVVPNSTLTFCDIEVELYPLAAVAGSGFRPTEVRLVFQGNVIARLNNRREPDPKIAEKIHCIQKNEYRFLFVNTSGLCLDYRLCDASTYVSISSDAGVHWSGLVPARYESAGKIYELRADNFSDRVRVLGDEHGFALAFLGWQPDTREKTLLFFTRDLKLLRTVPQSRLTYAELPSCELCSLASFDGRIYFSHPPGDGRGISILETSSDLGRSWQETEETYSWQSYFFESRGDFYMLSARPGRTASIFPALSAPGGSLGLRRLIAPGRWTPEVRLLSTVTALLGVSGGEHPLVYWRDARRLHRRICGFIPLIGCIDSGPHMGPLLTFRGELDPQRPQLSEEVFSVGPQVQR